jgi:quercetin 2,3-dioxygenase
MKKSISKITQQAIKPNTMGFKSVDIFHGDYSIEPFLVFTEYHMDRAIFGPHPHAGVSVMTYMLPDSNGSFLNRDSHGDSSIIEPGGVHVTQAGSGIQHDEVPSVNGIDCHGFQIWINHSDANRMVEPKAFHLNAKDVPEHISEQMKVRIIAGSFAGKTSPLHLVTKTILLDISLAPHTAVELDTKEMAFIYVMSGSIVIDNQTISGNAMINFESSGDKILLNTGDASAHFMFASGTPHNEPIVYGGAYVMTTNEQMTATKQKFARGEMGELKHL